MTVYKAISKGSIYTIERSIKGYNLRINGTISYVATTKQLAIKYLWGIL